MNLLVKAIQKPNKFRKLSPLLQRQARMAIGLPLSLFSPGSIAMFHPGRCGSTVLGNLLNQHSKIYWDGEIYKDFVDEWREQVKSGKLNVSQRPQRILRKRAIAAGSNYYGFEVKPYHIKAAGIGLDEYVDFLESSNINNFILLTRKNHLRQIVSACILQKTRSSYRPIDKQQKLTKVDLDLKSTEFNQKAKSLICHLHGLQQEIEELERILANKRMLRLNYEEHIQSNPTVAYEHLCKFIKIEEQRVSPKFGKMNPFKLSEIIINFKEIEDLLKNSPFEWMLYE